MRDIFLDIDGSAAWKSEIDRWVDNKIPWDMWAYVLSCTGWVWDFQSLSTIIIVVYFVFG